MTAQAVLVVLVLSIGANLDNLGVGSAYALTGKRIGWWANVTIGAVSAVLALVAAWGSSLIGAHVSQDTARYLSGGILVVLGLWALLDGVRAVLRPARAAQQQVDPSLMRDTGLGETVVLSFALAINAAAAGLAIGFAGYPAGLSALSIGAFSIVAIAIGQGGASQVAWRIPPVLSNALGGVLLVAIGVAELR